MSKNKLCNNCNGLMPQNMRNDALFCSGSCRVLAHRKRCREAKKGVNIIVKGSDNREKQKFVNP